MIAIQAKTIQAVRDQKISQPIPIDPKRCKCGAVHFAIPAGAKLLEDEDLLSGYYFNCDCGSTLFVPTGDVKRASA